MFYKCEKLKILPDLNRWNLKNCLYMSNVFSECNLLINIPNFPLINNDEENIKENNNIIYENFFNDFGFNNLNKLEDNSFINNNDNSFDENSLDKIVQIKFDNHLKFINS